MKFSLKTSVVFWILIPAFVHCSTGISYNLPKFCPNATWDSNATTFADNSTVGEIPFGIFVDIYNTVHVTAQDMNLVQVWLEGSINPTRTLSGNLTAPNGIFATIDGDVYVDNGNNRQIDKWTLNSNDSVYVTDIIWECTGLFLDINLNIYCCIDVAYQVFKKSFVNGTYTTATVAGNGTGGSASNLLANPNGIFVDINSNLYIADWGNNRIQLFLPGQLNGITVAGSGATGTITLFGPTDVVLDADNYLYIADRSNSRIVGSGPSGFRCLVGCSGSSGLASDELNCPRSLSFDSYGNLFVTDTNNHRVQMFTLSTGLCNQTATSPKIPMTTNFAESSMNSQDTILSTAVSITRTVPNLYRAECYSPIITLIPSVSSLGVPVQFRRSRDFYISSIIQLNCPISLSMITQWTIINCTSICSSQIQTNSLIATTFSELFVPARFLPYGIYELKLTITMVSIPSLISPASVYVEITQSGITANLVEFGTSMITSSPENDLILDPGRYSVDPDSNTFDASNWYYTYYCQPYDLYNSTNYGPLLPIDQQNQSCFSTRSHNETAWQYDSTVSLQSSVRILAGSLIVNQTYRFIVYMVNRQNSSIQAMGYLLVNIENTKPQMIAVACIISTMCSPNLEYQFINPNTQAALFSVCMGNCSSLVSITWNIYQGLMNLSTNMIEWTPFTAINSSNDDNFFGMNTSNFTATNNLFIENSEINYWRFEVVYTFISEKSLSALNFLINQPPQNGSCAISPLNGTTSTLFTIICSDWFDDDGIQDYSFYVWTRDSIDQIVIGSTILPSSQLRLPAGDSNTSSVHIIIFIRDMLNAVTEYYMQSVVVTPDMTNIMILIDTLQQSNIEIINTNSIIQLISSGTQNIVAQVLTSLSQVLNEMNNQNIDMAISNGIPASSIFISPLGSTNSQVSLISLNASNLINYNKLLNTYANVRDYLIHFISNLPISTSTTMKLQASALAQFTDATNQLTRTTSMLASNKSYRISIALQLMSTELSFEDVQLVAKAIVQCSSNVLTAVNQPLQGRGISLDLDFNRANAFPDDYDTDLESVWSNLNLFADGDDFSWDTIEKGRNVYYQKQLANIIADQVMETFSAISAALKVHLNVGQNITINTSSVFFFMETLLMKSLSNKLIHLAGNAQILFPSNFNSTMNNNVSLSLRAIMQPLASIGNTQSLASTNFSTMISLAVFDQYENDIPLCINIDDPIEIIIPRDINMIIPSMSMQNVTMMNSHNRSFNLHYVNMTRNNNPTISLHLEMRPVNTTLAYLFIYRFDGVPQLNNSSDQIDGWSLFCPSNLTSDDLYKYFINNQQMSYHQSVIFGLRELNSTEMEKFCSNISIINNVPMISNDPCNFSSNYELRTYISGCYYLDSNNNWQSNGLIVGPLTNYYQTQCYATYPETYAAGFSFLPEPINWKYVFAHLDFSTNKNLYLAVICVAVIYLTLVIYARLQDNKDIEKLKVTPLPFNHKINQYFYQIIVFTGHRPDAGTKSKVHFILSGDDNETNIRTLTDPKRAIFQRHGIDSFVMAVPKSLGSLNYFRIWHDNTGLGSSASWFLNDIIVRDLQTMKRYDFICHRWLAVEKDDGAIERLLPVVDKYERKEFTSILSTRTYHNMFEKHLWFSIFLKSPSYMFTRVQRCTCCFVLLLFDMLLNILYYNQLQQSKIGIENNNGLSIGSFYITLEQIVIGIILGLFSAFPNLLFVQLFRHIRSYRQKPSPLRETLEKMTGHKLDSTKVSSRKRRFTFPWWFLFLAYGFSLLFGAMSIFFIIARGIEFGELETQKWLTSVVAGLFASIFLIEPIQVISLDIISTFLRRTAANHDKELEDYFDDDITLPEGEEYLHESKRNITSAFCSRARINRLNEVELLCAREQRFKELKMWSIIQEVLVYLCFVWILFVVSYNNRDTNSFQQVNHLRHFFLNIGHSSYDYTKITSIDEYWKWLEQSFVLNLRAQEWYNGDPPRNLSGFTNDKSNRLIGWAIVRQLRVKPKFCPRYWFTRSMNMTCYADYSRFNEEQGSFQPKWLNQSTIDYSSSIQNAFIYKSSDQLDTYDYIGDYSTYSGGGYVYEFRGRLSDLRSNLSQLHQLQWIDEQTRAVIIQLSLYNPNVQMFTSLTFLVEFLSSGGVYPTARFEPIHIQGFASIFYLIAAILYMIFIIYFMVVEIRAFRHIKFAYFYRLWSFFELGIIISSWTGVGICIWRYYELKRIGNLFRETNGFVYINLHPATYIDDIFNFLLGFCCFFGSLKLLYFCRFNRRLSILNDTLHHATKPLLLFMITFVIIFTAFLVLFYLLFVSNIWECSSLLHTSQMLFEMLLLNFDAASLYESNAFLGPFCFSLFIFFVVFVCMNIFISIIIDSFRTVRRDINLISNDDHIMFEYIIHKFQHWIGILKPSELERQEERDIVMRSKYYDSFEYFPELIDRILDILIRLHQNQKTKIKKHSNENIPVIIVSTE